MEAAKVQVGILGIQYYTMRTFIITNEGNIKLII